MIEIALRKAGVYALGDGGTIEVVAGEVVQVGPACPVAQSDAFGDILSRTAKAARQPSARTAPRYVTSAVMEQRRAAAAARGVDPAAVTPADGEIVIPSVTRAEWEARNAPEPAPEQPEQGPGPEEQGGPEQPETPAADEPAGASSASVRKAVSKGKGSPGAG